MLSLNLTAKNVIVCGSTAGIGKAIALVLAEMGADVILAARNEEKLKSVLTSLSTETDQTHRYIVADFSEPEALRNGVSEVLDKVDVIHVVINNTSGPLTGPLLEKSATNINDALSQHLICSHLLAQATVPGMVKAEYGRIINITSNAAKQPLPNMGLSNTVRGAVSNWAKTLANELGPSGITVNNVLPGATDTDELRRVIAEKSRMANKDEGEIERHMHTLCPAQRFGTPREIAYAVGFLASPQAAYINGINLVVDGGKTSCL